jgi:hypothetical protein
MLRARRHPEPAPKLGLAARAWNTLFQCFVTDADAALDRRPRRCKKNRLSGRGGRTHRRATTQRTGAVTIPIPGIWAVADVRRLPSDAASGLARPMRSVTECPAPTLIALARSLHRICRLGAIFENVGDANIPYRLTSACALSHRAPSASPAERAGQYPVVSAIRGCLESARGETPEPECQKFRQRCTQHTAGSDDSNELL